MTGRWAVMMGFALAVAACGGPEITTPAQILSPPPGMTIDCGDVPEDACTFVAAGYGTSTELVSAITMRCEARTCSAASGKTDVGLLYVSGQRMSHGTEWGVVQADPAPRPVPPIAPPMLSPTCIGIERPRCLEMAQAGDVPLGAPSVTSVTVRCKNGACAEGIGDGETIIRFEDGTRSTVGWTYGG